MKEFWMPIPGVPGYSASNMGRIRSEDRITEFTRRGVFVRQRSAGKILREQRGSNGYKMVSPVIDGENRPLLVHRLVWSAFNGPIPDKMTVNHLDKDIANNSLGNIHICTQSENNRLAGFDREKCERGHALTEDNLYYYKNSAACRECKRINWASWYQRNKGKRGKP